MVAAIGGSHVIGEVDASVVYRLLGSGSLMSGLLVLACVIT